SRSLLPDADSVRRTHANPPGGRSPTEGDPVPESGRMLPGSGDRPGSRRFTWSGARPRPGEPGGDRVQAFGWLVLVAGHIPVEVLHERPGTADPGRPRLVRRNRATAGHNQARHTVVPGRGRHPRHHLAAQRLAVEPALAG